MILETALCNLKDDLMLSGYFNRIYEYAEQIERNNEKFPQVYTGNGQYKMIYDFDVNGSGYFRKNGDSRIETIGSSWDVTACNGTNPLIDIVYPIRFVGAVPKSMLDDNSFSDDLLALELIGYIGKKQPSADTTSVVGRVTSYTTDRDRVWSDEVRGIEKMVDLRLSFIAIDFYLSFRTNLDCIKQTCY